MKKREKGLRLSRETLRNLENVALQGPRGGTETDHACITEFPQCAYTDKCPPDSKNGFVPATANC